MKVNYDLAVVKKSNALVESSYKLSANEQKILLIFMSMIKQSDRDFHVYKIPVQTLAKVLDVKTGNIYTDVRSVVRSLQSKTLSIYRDDEKSILDVNWLSSAKYYLGEGMVELVFDPTLKPYLLNLKQKFTTYRLKDVAKLKSNFSIRIFELLKQFENLGSRVIAIKELREILEILPNQYTLYANFKKKVLLKAQEELTKQSNLTFDFEEVKECRKVIKIRFIIKRQLAVQAEQLDFSIIRDIEDEEINTELDKLVELLPGQYQKQVTIRKKLAENLEKHGFDYVARNIAYSNANSNAINKGKNILKKSNYRGYLTKSLKNDFGLEFQEDKIIKQASAKATKEEQEYKAALDIAKQKKILAEKMAVDLIEEQKELTQKHIAKLSSGKLKELEEEAIQAMDEGVKNIVINRKTGWKPNLQLKMNEVLRKRLFSD